MRTNDSKIDNAADVTKRMLSIGFTPAINLTNAVVELIKLPHNSKVLGASLYSRAVAGTVAADLRLCASTGILAPGILAIDAVPEKFKLITNTIVALYAGAVKTKAPATAIVFTAAHVVSALKYGVILVQMTSAGVVSTKVSSATQAFSTAAAALAAIPAADANNLAIGYIAINAGALAWTANTDDMTNGSDLTTATFNNYSNRKPLTGAISPTALANIAGVMSVVTTDINAAKDEYLAVLATTDGTGALTDGRLHIEYRARNYRGD